MKTKKRLDVTQAMLEQIQRVTQITVDPSNIAVFEAAALSTNALNKPGSIYHEARPSRALLAEMVQGIVSGAHSVPMHTLHNQGGELPVGRAFDARLVDQPDGSTTMVTTFYLPTTAEDLISSIELGILDEVSVGMMSKTAKCSACDFDFFGGDMDALWDRTCPSGHTLNVNGVHLKLDGLDRWTELSLVSRGAADKPKILSRVSTEMPQATYDRLAASGVSTKALMLYAATPMMESDMNQKTGVTAPANPPADQAPAQAFDAQAAFEALTAQIANLMAATAPAAAPVEAAATPDADPAPAAVANPEMADLLARLAAAEAKLNELAAPPAADPAPVAEVASTPAAEVAPSAAAAIKLSLPTGGIAASAVADATKTLPAMQASAFKTRR